MKKSLLALTAALAFGMAAAQDAAPASAPQVPALTDVPAGHWAKDAIDKLVSQGIILGYPDGTYRGTQNLTRYEAAVIIARLLNQMGTGSAPAMDAETLTALQNAIQELAADLAALGVRVSDLEANAVSKDDFTRLEQRVEQLGSATPSTTGPDNSAAVDANTAAISDIQGQISDVTARADDLQANYDTLRADVDDNASSIAALNDLTVLLNQDILNLQDRASAIEAAQADFVQRADFDNLAGRVGVVETKVTDYGNRIAALEKNAFSIKPTLTATYFVARADRDMDIDRLFPGTKFSSGDDGDSGTVDTPVDYVDLAGNTTKVNNNQNGLYGFSTSNIVLTGVDGTGAALPPKIIAAPDGLNDLTTYTISPADAALGYTAVAFVPFTPVNNEGATTLDFGIDFSTAGGLNSATSANTGAYLTSAGGVAIKSVDVKFGITTNPSLTGTQTAANLAFYPAITDSNNYTYKPLFFYFKNGTATFTVGNNPVIVDFGRSLKTKFGDYIFDNNLDGRGDGFTVTVDGSNVPIIGAFKPVIMAIYGSSNLTFAAGGRYYTGLDTAGNPVYVTEAGANTHFITGANGDYRYYRGIRAEITPIGTLKLGINAVEEALDATGYKLTAGGAPVLGVRDVVAYGADAHGSLYGFQLDSEYAHSKVTGTFNGTDVTERTANAFYAKTGGIVGPVQVYDLNFRSIDAGFNKEASISEAIPGDGTNGSTALYNRGNRTSTPTDAIPTLADGVTPAVPLGTSLYDGQIGAAAKIGGTLGPVSVGGYYNTQTAKSSSIGATNDPKGIVDYGVTAKASILNLVTLRGGYYYLYAGATSADVTNQAKGSGSRYEVRADVTPGFGLTVGAFYRYLALGGTKFQNDTIAYNNGPANNGTASLFANSHYSSIYTLADNKLTDQAGCGAQHPSTSTDDTDAVGGALTFSLGAFSDATCYSEYGAEIQHNGKDAAALVNNLDLRFGYAQRYRNATGSYSGNVLYADALYGAKLSIFNVNLKALYNQTNYNQSVAGEAGTPDLRTIAAGLRVTTDTLDYIFKPSLEAQVGYLSRNRSGATEPVTGVSPNFDNSGLSYRAGVKLKDVLLPTAQLAVYYGGLRTVNRAYVPWTNSTDNSAGYYTDTNNGYTINQNGLYVEGNYYDLSFAYGLYSLSAKNSAGTEVAVPGTNSVAKGSTFKITYKVTF